MTISPLSIASDGYLTAGTGQPLAVASSGYLGIFGEEVPVVVVGGGGVLRRQSDFDLGMPTLDEEDAEITAILSAFLAMTATRLMLP